MVLRPQALSIPTRPAGDRAPARLQRLSLLAEGRRGFWSLELGRRIGAADDAWRLQLFSAIECTNAGAILVALGRFRKWATGGLVRFVSHQTVGGGTECTAAKARP
jgi:hypothetical protein